LQLRIKSLAASAGYLEYAPIHFADRLTCIIGARGTCKSTVVETLRFVFNCDTSRCNDLAAETQDSNAADVPSYRGLVRVTLAGGTAHCELEDAGGGDQSAWTIERDLDSPPRVFHDGVKEVADLSLLSRIEIYSQGDLQRIAQFGDRRLDLIDRPNKVAIDGLLERRKDTAARLRNIGPKLRPIRAAIEGRRAEVKALEGFRSSLRELQRERPELSAALETERAAFLRRKDILDRAREAVDVRTLLLSQLAPLVSSKQVVKAACNALAEIQNDDARSLRATLDEFVIFLIRITDDARIATAVDALGQMERLRLRFETENEAYYALRKEQQSMNEALKREDALRQQIHHLEGLQRELEQLIEQERKLLADRTSLRAQIEEIGDELYRLRLDQVDQVNVAHSQVVLLSLHQGTQSEQYRLTVAQILQGSRIRSQDEVARDLADKVRPADLVDIVEHGDAQRLAAILDRDLGQMARLVAYLLDHPTLHEVECATFDDWLEITMFVDGVAKPINQLSKGQMATALLPLILREADYPLVFDQPEDDLDNRFVFETLVKMVSKLKVQRQLIFITHNANIPVLGEAEHVVVMSMTSPTKAAAPMTGDVESVKKPILGLLEGGAEAFRRRQQKYGDLVG
jgi:hypothetical protein